MIIAVRIARRLPGSFRWMGFRDPNKRRLQISVFDEVKCVGKLRISAFQRILNRQKRISGASGYGCLETASGHIDVRIGDPLFFSSDAHVQYVHSFVSGVFCTMRNAMAIFVPCGAPHAVVLDVEVAVGPVC